MRKNELEEIEIDDLMYEIELLLRATLFYAGVKKDNLEKVRDLYVEHIDEILQNSEAEGVDEIIEVVSFLKERYPKFFI